METIERDVFDEFELVYEQDIDLIVTSQALEDFEEIEDYLAE